MRWHGRLESQTIGLPLTDAQLALVLPSGLCAGNPEAISLLRGLLPRLRPILHLE